MKLTTNDQYLRPHEVRSAKDLAIFALSLRSAFEDGCFEDGNTSLPAYLEALSGWTRDLPGYFLNRGEMEPPEPTWGLIAVMLLTAAVYD